MPPPPEPVPIDPADEKSEERDSAELGLNGKSRQSTLTDDPSVTGDVVGVQWTAGRKQI